MTSRENTLGAALVICALAVGAFAAAHASAAGLTAVKCVEVGGGGKYNTSQCTTPAVPGNFETVAIEGSTNIEGQATTAAHKVGSTAEPGVVTQFTISGVEVKVTCGTDKVLAGAKITNLEEGGEMKVHGTGLVITNSECHAAPRTKPTKICSVQSVAPEAPVGQIKTNPMTTTSGTEHSITVQPQEGEVFNKLKILASGGECFTGTSLEIQLSGKVKGIGDTTTHSHITFNAATNGGEFKANGGAATVEATIQTWMEGKPGELVGVETF